MRLKGFKIKEEVFNSLTHNARKSFRFSAPQNPKRILSETSYESYRFSDIYDMNVYVVINKELMEKDLNSLKIISAYKVKRKIQEKIIKNES